MAVSPAHRWGQIIGEVLEGAVVPVLRNFARKHGLFLDQRGERPCRAGRKCVWTDLNGNAHDLDFVLERGGTPNRVGTPVAFIEVAWRRYSKHSRNKAQEIQGAIVPLAETYSHAGPFKGAILAGVFTDGALTQMRSLGFTILYFPYEMIVGVFRAVGIDASSEENTPDADFQENVNRYEQLTVPQRSALSQRLMRSNAEGVREFINALTAAVSRRIERIIILPLHGTSEELLTIDDAIAFLRGYDDTDGGKPVRRYEIQIRYNNGDVIEGKFADKESAVEFLRTYRLTAST